MFLLSRCVNYGVLPYEEAAKLYKRLLKRKKGGSAAAAVDVAPVKKKKKPKIIKEEGGDPDMQISGDSAVGRAVL